MSESSESVTQIAEALAAFQGAVEPPQRTKTAAVEGETQAGKAYKYNYKYAPLEEIARVIKAPLAEQGLSWWQGVMPGQPPIVRTHVMHRSGEWFVSDYPVMPTKAGHQGLASGVTYARRYGISLALGIAAEDDDANAADEQAALITSKPETRRATRTAAPRQPAPAPAAAAGSDHANGDGGRPKWLDKFFAQDSYEIDPQKAGGWSSWEKFYLTACDQADNIDQIHKLENDNGAWFAGFREIVKEAVYVNFRARVEAAEARLWREPDVTIVT